MSWQWARAAALPSEKLQAGIHLRLCFAWENQDNSSGLEPLTWYLGPALLPPQYLRKAMNNCTCDRHPLLLTPGNTVSITNAI